MKVRWGVAEEAARITIAINRGLWMLYEKSRTGVHLDDRLSPSIRFIRIRRDTRYDKALMPGLFVVLVEIMQICTAMEQPAALEPILRSVGSSNRCG